MVSRELPQLAIAIPAFNEEEALRVFLPELDAALSERAGRTVVCICDDASTDGTKQVVESLAPQLQASLTLQTRTSNGGHGPTLLDAYHMALATGAEIIAQVDGDGQFLGEDLVLVVDGIRGSVEVSTGCRSNPATTWYRRLISRTLRRVLRLFGSRHPDPNVPLRAYRRDVLDELLRAVPVDALVPNALLTALADDRQVAVTLVTHRPRIGEGTGTMWGSGRLRSTVRLAVFAARAFHEVLSVLLRR